MYWLPFFVSSYAQLVAAERKPADNRINSQGTAATAKLSALGNIKSSLTGLQGALEAMAKSADIRAYKATVPENSGFSASIITLGKFQPLPAVKQITNG